MLFYVNNQAANVYFFANEKKVLIKKDIFAHQKNVMLKIKTLRSLSIFWALFIGIGALWGALMMFIDPSGKMWGLDAVLPYLQKLPFADIFFRDFIPSGIVLLLVNGVTNFISFALICKKHRYAPLSVILCGIVLMLWITVEFVVFPLGLLPILYFIFGMLQTGTGYLYWKK